MDKDRKIKVIFLCTGNSARSQMAEAFLRRYAGDQFEAHSAGLEPKEIHPYTIIVMGELGYSLEGQQSKSVRENLGKVHFTYLFTVCSQAEKNCPRTFLSSGIHTHWDFEDPAAFEGTEEEKLAKFREIRDQIDERIRQWLQEQII
ncbi:MAG: arsenate reductase ArsC [Anaerolineales bacterium]|nr:arsenate reductase ArsC [Anaerolineales bacterium]